MKRDRIETLKHNAKLDVRLPDQLKDEFLARCREEGVSSGAVIRSLILDYVTAQPRRVPVMAARLKETIMKRYKWAASGIATACAAAITAAALVFPPLATADESLFVAYRIVARETPDGTIWRSMGRLEDALDQVHSLDFPNEDMRLNAQVTDCARVEIDECGPDQAYILLNVWSRERGSQSEQWDNTSFGMRVFKGRSGSIDTSLSESLRLDVVFTPID